MAFSQIQWPSIVDLKIIYEFSIFRINDHLIFTGVRTLDFQKFMFIIISDHTMRVILGCSTEIINPTSRSNN